MLSQRLIKGNPINRLEKIIYILQNKESYLTKMGNGYKLVCEKDVSKCSNCKMRIFVTEISYRFDYYSIDIVYKEKYNYIQNSHPELFI